MNVKYAWVRPFNKNNKLRSGFYMRDWELIRMCTRIIKLEFYMDEAIVINVRDLLLKYNVRITPWVITEKTQDLTFAYYIINPHKGNII
jgi:hypothetical protein